MSVSDKVTPWLTTEFKKLARSRDKLKIAAVKNKSSILMSSYRHLRNRVNNLNKQLKRDYFSNKIASYRGSLKDSWRTINQLLNKRSKTTNIDSVKVDDHEINEPAEVSRAMNDYFCSVGKKLRDNIPPQPNPLLSNKYTINENTTNFEFNAIDATNAERAFAKMKKSFGFGSDGIASHFINVAFPIISQSLCSIFNFLLIPENFLIVRKLHALRLFSRVESVTIGLITDPSPFFLLYPGCLKN